jgi:hypothetical protein
MPLKIAADPRNHRANRASTIIELRRWPCLQEF